MLDRSRSAWTCAEENSPPIAAGERVEDLVEEDVGQGTDPMLIHASDWILCRAEELSQVKARQQTSP
jgi:hypothetical protein